MGPSGGDAAPFGSVSWTNVDCFDDCGRLARNFDVRPLGLESRLDKLSKKYKYAPNRVRMREIRPFESSSVSAVGIGIRNVSNSNS